MQYPPMGAGGEHVPHRPFVLSPAQGEGLAGAAGSIYHTAPAAQSAQCRAQGWKCPPRLSPQNPPAAHSQEGTQGGRGGVTALRGH